MHLRLRKSEKLPQTYRKLAEHLLQFCGIGCKFEVPSSDCRLHAIGFVCFFKSRLFFVENSFFQLSWLPIYTPILVRRAFLEDRCIAKNSLCFKNYTLLKSFSKKHAIFLYIP